MLASITRQIASRSSNFAPISSFSGCDSLVRQRRLFCTQPAIAETSQEVPKKETLLRIDWLLEKVTPLVLKSQVRSFVDICNEDVQLDDRLYNYKLGSRSSLMTHIAKVRLYHRYLSPFNKVEWIGSCVYENEDVIVVLWRLTTLQSSFWSYFPSFLTKKEPVMNVKEGALDVHIDAAGRVYKLVNRVITASDREGAKALGKIKTALEAKREKDEEKKLRREFDSQFNNNQ